MLLEVFTQKNFVANFVRMNLNFIHKNDKSLFEPPFGELLLGVTYVLHLQFVGKRMVDFLFAIIEHFSLALTVETL